MIDILFKGTDTRQSVTHANGTIGKIKWVASYSRGWKVTIPAGCDNGIETIGLVKERLTELYPEG